MARGATNRPFSLFPKSVLFVGGDLPPRHKRLTSNGVPNGVRAYVPPDTHIVDRITADTSSHHKSMLYEWRGRRCYHIDPLSAIPSTVFFVDYSYFFGNTLLDRARHCHRYLGGGGGTRARCPAKVTACGATS